MAKRRRKVKAKVYGSAKKVPVETPAQMRVKLPKELVDAYMNLHHTRVKVKHPEGFEYYEWTDKAYRAYAAEAKKYLGKNAEDKIESGKLVVNLARATMDLREDKNGEQQKKPKKKTKVRAKKAKGKKA